MWQELWGIHESIRTSINDDSFLVNLSISTEVTLRLGYEIEVIINWSQHSKWTNSYWMIYRLRRAQKRDNSRWMWTSVEANEKWKFIMRKYDSVFCFFRKRIPVCGDCFHLGRCNDPEQQQKRNILKCGRWILWRKMPESIVLWRYQCCQRVPIYFRNSSECRLIPLVVAWWKYSMRLYMKSFSYLFFFSIVNDDDEITTRWWITTKAVYIFKGNIMLLFKSFFVPPNQMNFDKTLHIYTN